MIDPEEKLLVYTKYAADISRFRRLLGEALPGQTIAFATTAAEASPHLENSSVLYGWGFAPGMVKAMPKLRWIQKMGAGVDDLAGPRWPFGSSVLLTRTDGRLIAPRMVEYAVAAALRQSLQLPALEAMRAKKHWSYVEIGSIRQHTVGIAGLGEIGTEVATAFRALGAKVVGWRRTAAECSAVSRVFAGRDQLGAFLSECSVVVLVLPHTNETVGLFDAEALRQLKPGCHLINVGRGGVVDETALLEALDDGRISHASLDVFATEPLPPEHRFWTHPRVTLTPHIAGPLIPEDVVPHFIDNVHAFRAGRPLKNIVDPQRQY